MHNCDYCGHEVRKDIRKCPSCGAVYERSFKRFFFTITMLVPLPYLFTKVAIEGFQADKFQFIDYLIAPAAILLSLFIAYKALIYSLKKRWVIIPKEGVIETSVRLSRPIGFQDK